MSSKNKKIKGAEIARHASRRTRRLLPPGRSAKLDIFFILHSSSYVEFGITVYTDLGRLLHASATSTYHDACPFQRFVAVCDHNPLTLQTDGQRDRQTDKQTAWS